MEFQQKKGRVLCLHAAAKRLQIPERTLRYRASRGYVQGAFKQGKLWKFWMPDAALGLVSNTDPGKPRHVICYLA
jgi:hypothetical protein